MTISRWHALEVKRGSETSAATEIVRQGYRVFMPVVPMARITQTFIDLKPVLRFPPYIFAQFALGDPWGLLIHDEGKRAGIVRILCDSTGKPGAVPDRAMEAMRAYVPDVKNVRSIRKFKPGEQVRYYTAGVPQSAVFVCYERMRAKVKIWMLGAERIVRVDVSALEGMGIDSLGQIASMSGPGGARDRKAGR